MTPKKKPSKLLDALGDIEESPVYEEAPDAAPIQKKESKTRKPSLEGRRGMTIHIPDVVDDDMEDYLLKRKRITGQKMTKQQFIETAITRELARVRGRNPEEVPEAPNYQRLAQQRRRGKDG